MTAIVIDVTTNGQTFNLGNSAGVNEIVLGEAVIRRQHFAAATADCAALPGMPVNLIPSRGCGWFALTRRLRHYNV